MDREAGGPNGCHSAVGLVGGPQGPVRRFVPVPGGGTGRNRGTLLPQPVPERRPGFGDSRRQAPQDAGTEAAELKPRVRGQPAHATVDAGGEARACWQAGQRHLSISKSSTAISRSTFAPTLRRVLAPGGVRAAARKGARRSGPRLYLPLRHSGLACRRFDRLTYTPRVKIGHCLASLNYDG